MNAIIYSSGTHKLWGSGLKLIVDLHFRPHLWSCFSGYWPKVCGENSNNLIRPSVWVFGQLHIGSGIWLDAPGLKFLAHLAGRSRTRPHLRIPSDLGRPQMPHSMRLASFICVASRCTSFLNWVSWISEMVWNFKHPDLDNDHCRHLHLILLLISISLFWLNCALITICILGRQSFHTSMK